MSVLLSFRRLFGLTSEGPAPGPATPVVPLVGDSLAVQLHGAVDAIVPRANKPVYLSLHHLGDGLGEHRGTLIFLPPGTDLLDYATKRAEREAQRYAEAVAMTNVNRES